MATIVSLGKTMLLLLTWSMGLGTCERHRSHKKAPKSEESSGTKRHFTQFSALTNAATNSSPAATSLLDYGCWCGPGGHGKVVDDLDLCCKVHDNCYGRIEWISSCSNVAASLYTTWYRLKTVNGAQQCDTVSSYGDDADAQCKYDLCYCDWVAAQCFGQKKSLYSTDKNDYSDTHVCNNTGEAYTNNTADISIMIQVSHSITTATFAKAKSIAEKLVTRLDSTTIDCKFSFGVYATTQRMGPFRDAASTKTAIRNYPSDDIGQNTYTEYAIQMIKTQFTEPRPNEGLREGAVRISVLMTDGVSEEAPDTIMSVYRIAKEAKQIKDENNIKFVGALLSTTQRTPRIDELQSVVSEVNDAVDAVPSTATAEKVAKELAFRVKRWIRPVSYKVLAETTYSSIFGTEGTDDWVFIQIFGTEGKTGVQLLYKPSSEVDVFERGQTDDFHFSDGDVGTINRIGIKRRISGAGFDDDKWTLSTVTVTKGDQTKEFAFNKVIDDLEVWYFENAVEQADVTGDEMIRKHGGKRKQKLKGERKHSQRSHGNKS